MEKSFHLLILFCFFFWKNLKFLLEKVGKIKIFMHQRKKDLNRQFSNGSIVIMNHRTRLDWMFYFCVLYRLGKTADIKIIPKRGLESIPGAGWGMQAALFIFLYRKWEVDQKTFTDFIEYFRKIGKKPWVSEIMFQIC